MGCPFCDSVWPFPFSLNSVNCVSLEVWAGAGPGPGAAGQTGSEGEGEGLCCCSCCCGRSVPRPRHRRRNLHHDHGAEQNPWRAGEEQDTGESFKQSHWNKVLWRSPPLERRSVRLLSSLSLITPEHELSCGSCRSHEEGTLVILVQSNSKCKNAKTQKISKVNSVVCKVDDLYLYGKNFSDLKHWCFNALLSDSVPRSDTLLGFPLYDPWSAH